MGFEETWTTTKRCSATVRHTMQDSFVNRIITQWTTQLKAIRTKLTLFFHVYFKWHKINKQSKMTRWIKILPRSSPIVTWKNSKWVQLVTWYNSRKRRHAKWVLATVHKVHGVGSVNVKVHPRGPIWKRHINQPHLLYGAGQDDDPAENFMLNARSSSVTPSNNKARPKMPGQQLVSSPLFDQNNPRCAKRARNAPCRLNLQIRGGLSLNKGGVRV